MTGVIHVVTALERGGAQRVVLETAARLHDPGRPQLVVTGAPAALDAEAQARLGTRLLRAKSLVHPVDPLRDAAAVLELSHLLDRAVSKLGAPVVIHTHSSKAGVLGRLAARSVRGAYAVHTVHGFGLDALGPKRRWLLEAVERASSICDVVLFVSEADRDTAMGLGLFRGARSEIVRAGVDAPAFATLRDDVERRLRARAALFPARGEGADGPVAVTVANLKPQKDPLFHLEILRAWRERVPGARLAFLGDGPLRADVEARARGLGLGEALALPGFVDDPRDALAAGDVFLLGSAWEGLPCAVLEATAAGLPCVVRDTGYMRDLAWAKSVCALPLESPPEAFAAALVDVMTKPRKASRLPRAFTLTGMLADLAALYDELIGPPRPTGPLFARRPPRRRSSTSSRAERGGRGSASTASRRRS